MRRREFIALLGAAAVVRPLAAVSQTDKVFRVGILETQPAAMNSRNLQAFREALQALGYMEGKNLVIEYRSADGRAERFPRLIAELLRLRCDVIVTRGTPAVLAAKNATTTTPIVMAAIGEPLLVVASLKRPGANVTGMSGYATDLEAKRVEILHELTPTATRIGGLYNMGNLSVPPQWNELRKASEFLGLHARLFDIRTPGDIPRAFDVAISEQIEVIAVGVDALTQANRKMIADLAMQHRLPAIYVSREYVEAGGLLAYGPSYPSLYGRAAAFVDKILKGTKPAELPIEQPTKFELVINLKTAKALGLAIPPSLIARADRVIE
jgi:putative ABC transport system substrate-binding protein